MHVPHGKAEPALRCETQAVPAEVGDVAVVEKCVVGGIVAPGPVEVAADAENAKIIFGVGLVSIFAVEAVLYVFLSQFHGQLVASRGKKVVRLKLVMCRQKWWCQ